MELPQLHYSSYDKVVAWGGGRTDFSRLRSYQRMEDMGAEVEAPGYAEAKAYYQSIMNNK